MSVLDQAKPMDHGLGSVTLPAIMLGKELMDNIINLRS